MSRLLFLLVALVALPACDSGVEPLDTPDEPEAIAPLRAYVNGASFGSYRDPAVDDPFGVRLSVGGAVDATNETGAFFGAYLSGLWLGGQQDGETRANVVWYGRGGSDPAFGNFTSACGAGVGGLFALSADTVYTDTEVWPRDLGAPTNDDGSPRVYGDRMLWGSFCPVAVGDIPRFSSAFQNVRVNTAVYGYDDLEGVRFVRYEVTNTGASPLSGLRAGYFSDTDSPAANADAVGFDTSSGLSYVYNLRTDDAGQYLTPWVFGFAFLDTPKSAPLLAHRVMRKNWYENPEFGEEGVETAEQLVYALDGLSNDGEPMTDPTTGATTQFAFTGDPFADTGWRDGLFGEDGSYTGIDVRHLTSVSPIDLAAGETVTFTVVWVTAVEGSPSASYAAVNQTLSAVRAAPSRWRF